MSVKEIVGEDRRGQETGLFEKKTQGDQPYIR